MGDLEPRVDSLFKSVDCKSRNYMPCHGQAFVGENQLSCRNTEIVETGLLQFDIDISFDEDDLNALVLEELESLHIEQTLLSSAPNKTISQIYSPDTAKLLNPSKHATMLRSEVLHSCPAIFAEAESSTIELGGRGSSSVRNVAEDGMPLHVPSQLVSALKGSRARQGKAFDQTLHVKWAADVYDPPVTSSSHTVRGNRHHHQHHHHHRSARAKKDHCKHKHLKSKPSNAASAGSGERRSSQRGSNNTSIFYPRSSRLQALPSISLHAGFQHLKMQQVMEESNCGGSFHAKPPWPFSLPVAEAS